jgi:regulator of G-protein signaling
MRCVSQIEGAELFLAFLQSEFSEENLQFWLSCEEFKKLRGPALEHKARQIYSKYVKAGAPHEVIYSAPVKPVIPSWCIDVVSSQVNIDSETRNTVKANLTSPTPDMFDFSQHIIYTLMERDSYRRFLRSGNFTTFESGSSK